MEKNKKKKPYHFAIHLKLTQYCKSTIRQLKKKKTPSIQGVSVLILILQINHLLICLLVMNFFLSYSFPNNCACMHHFWSLTEYSAMWGHSTTAVRGEPWLASEAHTLHNCSLPLFENLHTA